MIFDSPAGGGPRMAPDNKTAPDVFAELFADPALNTPERQCGVYKASVRFNPEFAGPEKARCP
jgi:hypothetical protein